MNWEKYSKEKSIRKYRFFERFMIYHKNYGVSVAFRDIYGELKHDKFNSPVRPSPSHFMSLPDAPIIPEEKKGCENEKIGRAHV